MSYGNKTKKICFSVLFVLLPQENGSLVILIVFFFKKTEIKTNNAKFSLQAWSELTRKGTKVYFPLMDYS